MDRGKRIENSCKTPTKNTPVPELLAPQMHYKTPPSRITKVKNPFEHVLRENLGTNFISPTLFTAKKTVRTDKFSWTIDELAILKPAEIDEHSSNQFESPERDDHYDSDTQSRINSYFSMHQILPSPMQQPIESISLIKTDNSGQFSPVSHTTSHLPNVAHSYAQTILSLPPTLPEEVENVLQPYFTFTENQQGCEVHEKSVLYKALFDSSNHEEDFSDFDKAEGHFEAESSDSDIFAQSPKMSALQYKNSTQYQRTIGTPGNYDMMNLCPMSPINTGVKIVEDCKETSPLSPSERRNSSQVMSVDGSFTVPDGCVEKCTNSQSDASHHSSGSLSTSTMNWDLEYKQMSSPIASTHVDHSLNTPKQRFVHSQRKKLSDSFGNDAHQPAAEDDDDLAEEEEDDAMVVSQHRTVGDEDGESGYQTTSFQSLDSGLRSLVPTAISRTAGEDTWASVNVVSSTPTKRKQCL